VPPDGRSVAGTPPVLGGRTGAGAGRTHWRLSMCADSLSNIVTSTSSVDGLWRALTEERDTWWPELVLTPEVGSVVRETWTEDGREHFADGRVTAAVPPGQLAFVWQQPERHSPLTVSFDIRSDGDRSAVTVTERGFRRLIDGDGLRAAHEAGWTFHLANLLQVASLQEIADRESGIDEPRHRLGAECRLGLPLRDYDRMA
jgi:uncharacterized protein YndB with AHSA1/START domain